MPTAKRVDLGGVWPPGTQHYEISDGRYFAVIVDDTADLINRFVNPVGQHAVVVSPTVVVECDENGAATSMDRLYTLLSGTPHDEALRQVGYDVI
ncbi:hypothetical protein CUCO_29 [Mycobacterium phage Cuco]|uniref:DUF7572 domain-containing protein n=1 Tax=Mycobacterium phage Cuco TaxID=2922992 RepID=G1JUK4_9CAUD|nr:minor tail protein [Mycobacterium phage Cuco]AEL17679.1 hypothetical protein CUCO_29 [Mycobacterium phage Cuco]